MEDSWKIVQDQVTDLYDFRDHYFERNPIEEAKDKPDRLKEKVKSALETLEKYRAFCEENNKAQFHMLKGQILNVESDFDQEALESLSKSVKLNPKLFEAWNHLGECYWKKGDVQAARNCFEGALKHSKNKVSLRNLSMVLRQLGNTPQEKADNIQSGIDKAREAVQMDVEDGKSWYILGNAYLSFFFIANQNPKVLKLCMAAYEKALRDPVSRCDPCLHYNHATVLKYEEDYQGAIDGFEKAIQYDPLWTDVRDSLENFVGYVQQIQEMVTKKGCLKTRRLQTLLKSIKKHHLGPYADNAVAEEKGTKFEQIKLNQLQPGTNGGKVVIGKVVCNVTCSDPVAFTFCMIDDEETCCAVTVYNLAEGRGMIIGDSVAIPEPNLKIVKVKHKEKEFCYKSIRVDTPLRLVVNGKRLTADQHAPPRLMVTVTSD
ncbi:tetratricopeptide repeat protein 5-like [Centruroides vittatus]|uniref:tetratricopeptide repeat protein 5-like n=1 Tax=Centruroides vittatus TaxID=120091 RepID=UPI003510C4D5